MAFWLSTRHLTLSPRSLGALLSSSRRHRAAASTRTKTTYTSPNMPLHISDGQDKAQIDEEVEVLREQNWNLERESILVKTYHFKTYTKVTDFHQVVAVRSKSKNHHPEMITTAGSLTVRWTTHIPHGLSAKDTFMARYCDEQAKVIGTVKQNEAQRCDPGSTAS
ncbi:transcriptional coactivator/pterin dehydratase [Massariosphaeria phaeospora]|uniref:4a-hydroxytetrahydrobiopterin dehydratase n=1 Tax=Massariosphaeria phaeospora TaxID=100035 RepID=A0A7C8I2E4_9PLEO|nr:transcriptional coactivator/pterin dehydratase [Massariosphaeria phaeospora]